MKKVIVLFINAMISLTLFGQIQLSKSLKMKTIRAKSNVVSIREGNVLNQNSWTVVPSVKPDVYETSSDRVTFITDLDSISIKTKPGKCYDFVIIIEGDSAWTQIKCVPSKLEILKQAGEYAKTDTIGLPHFFYETPQNARLKDVKTYFKLDSIAGNGNEISKILNIMYWIHSNVSHDGGNYALAEFDAIDLYNYHKTTQKGINCRHLAISLNEMYLSMGFKSRYITCLPKDEKDQDCHVICSVWVDSLKKWIWIDPTFAAYIKDENGLFLGIEEVRERLINGKPLILNEDANWNNRIKQTKELYLTNYMAKNLYWFQAPLSSQFNLESRYRNNNVKYVSLLPLGYTRSDMKDLGTIIHDPIYFWQNPK